MEDQLELTPEILEMITDDTKNHYNKMRNRLLQETDKCVIPEFPITPDNLIIIKDY
jgi:hypothetical protein